MTAAAAIRRACDEGVHITCDGENLVLRASNPPTAEVIRLLKQHKADIIALLQAQTEESDPTPNLPWPLPGETLLPGWGTRVSMEYRFRVASVEECLEWAKEPWQLELVAKARGYSEKWVRRVAWNRVAWKELFANRAW